MPTYQTLLPSNIYQFLNSMANLYSAIEKEMHVALLAKEKLSNLEKRLQNKYQVDSTTVRNVYHNLKGKHTSIKELRKTQIKELKSSISSIKQSIKTQEKKYQAQLKKGQSTQKQRAYIHQKKRRLQIKKHKLEKLKTQSTSLCFGTKKLFKAQYHLEENGYANHQEWLKDWQEKRTSNFLMVGSKTYRSGNQLCRLNHEGNLTITVPPCLVKKYGDKITTQKVKFRHGQEFIDIALSPTQHKRGQKYRNGTQMPVTHRFVRKKGLWYIHTHVELPDIPWISHRRNGAIGIDLNLDNIAWAYCDSEGNLKDRGQINIDLDNKSSGQTTHILSVAIGKILEVATKYECPVVIEKLDFSSKKAKLREQSKGYAKMLSQFAYSKFAELVYGKAKLAAIQTIEVNPAYSSLIGMIKYMSLYGLNSGTAASLVLARRSLRLSERLPRVCNALASPVDGTKHVWTYWARISKLLKGCRRHSYFEMKVRVGVNTSIGYAGETPAPLSVKLDGREPSNKSRPGLWSHDTPVILSDISALDITAT